MPFTSLHFTSQLSGLRSASTVRSQNWRGRHLGRRQSSGRRLMEARSARAWSWAGSPRTIWPNGFRCRDFRREVTGGWPVPLRTSWLVTDLTAIYQLNQLCPSLFYSSIISTMCILLGQTKTCMSFIASLITKTLGRTSSPKQNSPIANHQLLTDKEMYTKQS